MMPPNLASTHACSEDDDEQVKEAVLRKSQNSTLTTSVCTIMGQARRISRNPNSDDGVFSAFDWIKYVDSPILGVDAHGFVRAINKRAEGLTTCTLEQMYNSSLQCYITADTFKPLQSSIYDAIKGKDVDACIVFFRAQDQSPPVPLHIRPCAQRDHEGNVVGVACFLSQRCCRHVDVGMPRKKRRSAEFIEDAVATGELCGLKENSSTVAIFGLDIDGHVNGWNSKMTEITGYTAEEALSSRFVDTFVDESSRCSVQEILNDARQGRETSNFVLELRTKSNEIRFLLLSLTTRRDIDDTIVGVVGMAQDITELTLQNREVAAMAHELRQFVDTANAPIFGVDVDRFVNEWNDKMAEITGFSGVEAFGKPLIETFIVPKLRDSVQHVLDSALQGKGTSNYELEFRTKSNEIRYLLVNATTRRDAHNNIVGVIGVAQDVTEAAKHERAVTSMAKELRHLIETANAPIFGIDTNGFVNEWNDTTAEITGISKDEALNRPLVETFIVPSLRRSVQAVMDNALQGQGTQNYELEFRTKSNKIRHLLLNATTRRDTDDNIVGVLTVAQDVTSSVQRDRAVASMAEELRVLIDTANAPIFGIDVEFNINEWNNKVSEITGYTKEEAFDDGVKLYRPVRQAVSTRSS